MNDEALRRIFESAKVIAAVGLSSKVERASYNVTKYLQSNGYRVIPVNPNETEVLGERAYPDLESVPEHIDVVQIYRNPDAVPPIVASAIAKGVRVIWMQDGAGNTEAAESARAAGATVVVDDCMMRQHARLFGK